MGQVLGNELESGQMIFFVADEGAANLVRHVHPLVKIEGERVSAGHPGEQVTQIWTQVSERAEGPVNLQVYPEITNSCSVSMLVVTISGSPSVTSSRSSMW